VTIVTNTRNGNLYKYIDAINPLLNVVGGSCPTVSISGFTLGGGVGFMSSWYGITAHYLKSVTMIMPNGIPATIDDTVDADLMWAIRGAGQNLGVITSFTFDFTSIP